MVEVAYLWRRKSPPPNVVVLGGYAFDGSFIRMRVNEYATAADAGDGAVSIPAMWMETEDQTSPLHFEEQGRLSHTEFVDPKRIG